MKTTALLVVVSLYFLAPLQQPINQFVHKISHAFSKTSSNHSHNNISNNNSHHHHTHNHQVITFFETLFSIEKNNSEIPHKTLKFDKHFSNQIVYSPKFHRLNKAVNFNHILNPYHILIKNSFPPPKVLIS